MINVGSTLKIKFEISQLLSGYPAYCWWCLVSCKKRVWLGFYYERDDKGSSLMRGEITAARIFHWDRQRGRRSVMMPSYQVDIEINWLFQHIYFVYIEMCIGVDGDSVLYDSCRGKFIRSEEWEEQERGAVLWLRRLWLLLWSSTSSSSSKKKTSLSSTQTKT